MEEVTLTLKKAKTLQKFIKDQMTSLELETAIKINKWSNASTVISFSEEKFTTNLMRRDNFLKAFYDLEKIIDKANSQSGITDRSKDVAHLNEQIGLFSILAKLQPKLDNAVIKGKQAEDNEFPCSVFDQGEIDSFKKMLLSYKLTKQRLEDEMLELEYKTTFTLDTEIAKFLKSEGLL